MKTIIEIIKADFITAFKAKDMIKKNILWEIKTKVVLFEKEKWEITDDDTIKIIKSKVKEIGKTLDMVEVGSELYNQAKTETSVLKEYLPAELEYSQVVDLVKEFITENNLEKKDFGRVMWTMSKKLNGKFDNSKLKDIINDII